MHEGVGRILEGFVILKDRVISMIVMTDCFWRSIRMTFFIAEIMLQEAVTILEK